MNNIFENAYFGKAYKTRDGRKAIYLGDNTCWIEGAQTEIGYSRNGLFVDFQEHSIDIVSEWKEEINEEEADEQPGFKVGYHKAMEKIRRLINRFLWKHFHFAIRLEKIAKYHPTDKVKMVYAKTAFGSVYKCQLKPDGKFLSINDGKEIEFVSTYYEI